MEIEGFGAFGLHLARLAAMGPEVTRHVTAEGAKAIAADAKSRFGSYQDGEGGFPAWANLAPATVDERLRLGYSPDDPLLRSGKLRDSIEQHAGDDEAVIGSRDPILGYQEFGTSTIPPRPTLGPAAFNSRHTVGPVAARTVIAWVCGIGFRRPRISLSDL